MLLHISFGRLLCNGIYLRRVLYAALHIYAGPLSQEIC